MIGAVNYFPKVNNFETEKPAAMKEKEATISFDLHPLVLYVEKEDGTYGRIESASFLAEKYLDDYLEKVKKWDKELKVKLEKGEISPVYYYKIMMEFGEGDLAARVGISKRLLRKHCQMDAFKNMKLKLLERYADVFEVPVGCMLNFLAIKEKDQAKINISFQKTNNPYISITKMELKQES
jgi:hypothetical protein